MDTIQETMESAAPDVNIVQNASMATPRISRYWGVWFGYGQTRRFFKFPYPIAEDHFRSGLDQRVMRDMEFVHGKAQIAPITKYRYYRA